MRDFLDEILDFIGSETLSDLEFDSIDLPEPPAYSKEMFDALKEILLDREEVSSQLDKLGFYFKARGVDIGDSDTAKPPVSNIFIGSEL